MSNEEIKIDINHDEIMKQAAEDFYKRLLNSDHTVNNLNGYIRERMRENLCDEMPVLSKPLRMRYNVGHNNYTQTVFAILEDWFNKRKENGK